MEWMCEGCGYEGNGSEKYNCSNGFGYFMISCIVVAIGLFFIFY